VDGLFPPIQGGKNSETKGRNPKGLQRENDEKILWGKGEVFAIMKKKKPKRGGKGKRGRECSLL